jgi:hypothetical protein
MSKYAIVVFLEGKSDKVFINGYLDYLKDKYGRDPDKRLIKIMPLNGIGNYKAKAIRKLKNEIIPNNADYSIIAACLYDTDVFEWSPNPPFDWLEIEKALYDNGASNVVLIKAEHHIEDWFLKDFQSICKHLGIKARKSISGKSGVDKMKKLYNEANRTYSKGETDSFVHCLNMNKIEKEVGQELGKLEELLYSP